MSDTPPPPPPPGSQPPDPPGPTPGTPQPGTPPPPPPSAGEQPPPPPVQQYPHQRPLGKRRSIGLVILLSIVTCGIWTIIWSFQQGEELKAYSGKGLGGLAYLFITLFVAPATMFLLANEVEEISRDEGREPQITTIWGLWFLLPIIGNIIWYVRIQNAINDHWTLHGQTNDPSL